MTEKVGRGVEEPGLEEGREEGGASEVQPLLSIMMTANERMGGSGLLSGIISLGHNEKEDNGNPSLSVCISDANNSRMDEKRSAECLESAETMLQRSRIALVTSSRGDRRSRYS